MVGAKFNTAKINTSLYHIASIWLADAFAKGIAPWSRASRLNTPVALPFDAKKGSLFLDLNLWLLEMYAIENNFQGSAWAIRSEWIKMGFQPQGEPSVAIGYFQDIGIYPVHLFCSDQVKGRRRAFQEPKRAKMDRDSLWNLRDFRVKRGGNKCFYRKETDTVFLPDDLWFTSEDEMISTRNHEWAHAVTLQPKRLLWRPGLMLEENAFLALAELVAEFCGMMLTSAMGYMYMSDFAANPWAPIWIKEMKKHPWFVNEASITAWKAYNKIVFPERKRNEDQS